MKKPILSAFSALFFAMLLVPVVAAAQSAEPPFEVAAKQAYLIDLSTHTVLYARDAETRMPPSSMAKLMTIYLAFDFLKRGEYKLDDKVRVNRDTWRKWRRQGSTMWVNASDEPTIEELLRGIIVQSGNDACAILADGMAGSEEYFVKQMNDKAAEIGLTDSSFGNTNGWPDPNTLMSAKDLAVLSQRLIEDFPEYYHYFAEREFTYAGITQPNRNPALGRIKGADGLKTGHTEDAGYGLAASAEREGRRLVLVVNGLTSEGERAREADRLMEWGFRNFASYKLFDAGAEVDLAPVWLGQNGMVPLVLENDLRLTLSRAQRSGMKVKVVYDAPIPAPITKGAPIARLVVDLPEGDDIQIPLLAGADVEKVGMFGKLGAAFQYMLWGASEDVAQ